MKALMPTNVGAVIAARSCLPVIVCLRVGVQAEPSLARVQLPRRSSVAGYVRMAAGRGIGGTLALTWWLFRPDDSRKWMTEKIDDAGAYLHQRCDPPTIALATALARARRWRRREVAPGARARGCRQLRRAWYHSGWRARSITATTFTLVFEQDGDDRVHGDRLADDERHRDRKPRVLHRVRLLYQTRPAGEKRGGGGFKGGENEASRERGGSARRENEDEREERTRTRTREREEGGS